MRILQSQICLCRVRWTVRKVRSRLLLGVLDEAVHKSRDGASMSGLSHN